MADKMTLIHPDTGEEHEFPTVQAFKMVNTKTQGPNWTFKKATKANDEAGSPRNNKKSEKHKRTSQSEETPESTKVSRKDEPGS